MSVHIAEGDASLLEQTLTGIPGVAVRRDVLLSENTTWRIGGPVSFWIDVAPMRPDFANVREVIEVLTSYEMPFAVIGGGSNILGADEGYAGAVIRITSTDPLCVYTDDDVYVSADVALSNLVRSAAQQGWTDFEFLTGIPGTVGGALAMNAGTGNQWIESVVDGITALVYADHNRFGIEDDMWIGDLKAADLTWDYRGGSLRDSAIILGATFRLTDKDEPENILARIARRLETRKSGQPLEYPSAGSVFRNPDGDNAWRLVDAVGLKGATCGGAQISEMHTNFIINKGGATARDVMELIERAQQRVFEDYGIRLQKEVRVLGTEA